MIRDGDAPRGPGAGGASVPHPIYARDERPGRTGYVRLFAISAMRSQPLSICSIEVANDSRM
jgi:hypothetical protein